MKRPSTPNEDLPSRSRNPCRGILWVTALLALLTFERVVAQEVAGLEPLSITGSNKRFEGVEASFAVQPFLGPLSHTTNNYSPNSAAHALPARAIERVNFTWDFGDGSRKATTGTKASAQHRYPDEGTYEVTVVASTDKGPFASGTRKVVIENLAPRHVSIESTPAPRGEEGEILFSATAVDVPSDLLTYAWDFGDGSSVEGEDLWQVRHTYAKAGRYTARVTVRDDAGAEDSADERIVVRRTDDEIQRAESSTESVETAFLAELHGAPAGGLRELPVRPLYGLYMSPTSSGECRLMLTAWDDANLGWFFVTLNLPNLSASGTSYKVTKPSVVYSAEPTRKAYLDQRNKRHELPGVGLVERAGGPGGKVDLSRLDSDADPATPIQGPTGLPADSPFGVESSTGFRTVTGQASYTVHPDLSVLGSITAQLDSEEHGTLRLEADFSIALDRQSSLGWVRSDECVRGPLQIVRSYPEDGEQHVRSHRPVTVRLDQKVDPVTLDAERVQLGYLDDSGGFQSVGGRLLPDEKGVSFLPEERLLPGVRHWLRLRAGAEGVRGVSGAQLEDVDGSGWRGVSFWSELDFTDTAEHRANLACHVYQTTRDAPLIPGKPAIARVYASWSPVPGVLASEQVSEFHTRAHLLARGSEKGVANGRFVRPDRWPAERIRQDRAEHTVQIPGLEPNEGTEWPLTIRLDVEGKAGKMRRAYRTTCPGKLWPHELTLDVDVFLALDGPWAGDDSRLSTDLPIVHRMLSKAREFALQLFPVRDVRISSPRYITQEHLWEQLFETASAQGLGEQMAAQSNADILVLLAPPEVFGGGGGMTCELGAPRLADDVCREIGRPGLVAMSISDRAPEGASDPSDAFERYVEGLIHEIGHSLGLEHEPYIETRAEQSAALGLRQKARLYFEGIEGFRIAADGMTGMNKSSTEGNEEDEALVPLMYPATVPPRSTFILHHHYWQLLEHLPTVLSDR